MKINFWFLILFFTIGCFDEKTNFIKNIELDEENVFLIFRGTNTKEGYFAKEFNIFDKNPSHVSIAVFDKKWKLYHVIDSRNIEITALVVSNLDDFFNLKDGKVEYASVWEIKNLTVLEKELIKSILNSYEKAFIKFDKNFMHNDSLNLYCSEFVVNILEKVNKNNFSFNIQKRKLSLFQSKFLKRDTLYYYPVDVFKQNKNIKLLKEWDFSDFR